MKKITLFIAVLAMSVMSYALNPFAYALSSSLSEDGATLTVKYSLNAAATAVNVVVLDGEEVVKTVDCSAKGLVAGAYTAEIATEGLPTGKNLTWKVEVKGTSVEAPTQETKIYSLYHPSAVDIDNNPENETFGLILANEAMQSIKGNDSKAVYKDYLSYNIGAGIFAFTPDFEPIKNTSGTYGYNGGVTFTTGRYDASGSTAYAPRRIRISEDGRIFVTSLNTDGTYLWEVNPKNLDEWTPVFKGTRNDKAELVDAEGKFIAGPNVGFDVKGSGENLQLLMMSCNLSGYSFAYSGYQTYEYNLGTAKEWSTVPTKNILGGKYIISYTSAQVEYDNEGGVWICQNRSAATDAQPSLIHINAAGVEDYKEVLNNRMNAGIRFNNDFTKVIIAGVAEGTTKSKKATIYTVSKDTDGKPVLTQEAVVDMTAVGNNLNDFAWDYAGNLYSCGNSSERLAAWAMPYSGTVATPAASKYAFELKAAAAGNTPLVCIDATVATEGQNIVISGVWGERPVTINLWQGGDTQGFGTYAAADYDGYALNPWVEFTAVSAGVYTDNGDETFTFTGTVTDGTVTYDVKISGSFGAPAVKIDMELECSNLKIAKGEIFYTFMGTSDMYSVELNLFATEYGEYKAQEIEGEMDYPIMGVVAGEACRGEGVYSYSEELGSDLLVAIVNVPALNMTIKVTMYGKAIVATDTIVVENMVKEITGRGYLQQMTLTGVDAKYGAVQFIVGSCDGSYGTYPAVYGTIDTIEVVGEGTWYNADTVDVLEAYLSTEDGTRTFKVTAIAAADPVIEPINITVYDATFTSGDYSLSVTGTSTDNKKIALEIYDWETIGFGEYEPYAIEGTIDDTVMVANLKETATLTQEGNIATLEAILNDAAGNIYALTVVGLAPAAPVADTIVVTATNMTTSGNQWDDNLRLQAKDAEGVVIDIVLFEGAKTGFGDYNYPAGSAWSGIETARYGDVFLNLNEDANFAKYYQLGEIEVFEGIFNDEDSGDVYIIKISTDEIPTSVGNIKVDTTNSKVIENGKLFIINNDTKYNANGAVVK